MIINLESIDFTSIKNDIENYLKGLSNYSDIVNNIPASTLELLKDIVAGYTTYLAYKFRREREEAYLSTAKLDESVYFLARMYGYNVNRYSYPYIEIVYNDTPTIQLTYGDILGTYNDGENEYEIIYCQDGKHFIEKGDIIRVAIGKSNKYVFDSFDEEITYEINPSFLEAISNEIYININDNIQKVSREPEDYLVKEVPVEFSKDKFSTKVYIRDLNNKYGYQGVINKLELLWIETNGFVESININNIKLDNRFYFNRIGNLGTFGDDLEKIKFIIPLYRLTMRRAVTIDDYNYILKTHPYFKDIRCMIDKGVPLIVEIKLISGKDDYYLSIGDHYYSFDLSNFDNDNDKYQYIYDYIKYNPYVIIELEKDENGNYIGLKLIQNDARMKNFIIDTDFDKTILQEQKEPICCSVLCYYLYYLIEDEPIYLNEDEQKDVSDFIDKYKTASAIFFNPAEKIEKDINIRVKTTDNEKAKTDIENIIKEYELQLEKNFYYGELLAKIGALEEVIYVLPNQEPFDIVLDGKHYIKFNIIINFED